MRAQLLVFGELLCGYQSWIHAQLQEALHGGHEIGAQDVGQTLSVQSHMCFRRRRGAAEAVVAQDTYELLVGRHREVAGAN